MTSTRKCSGFTIVEMMIVVAIIGLLAAVVAPRISRAMETAKAQKCRNNLKQLHAGVLGYMADHNGDTPCAQSFELFNAAKGEYSVSSSKGWIAWVPPGKSYDYADLTAPWEKDNMTSHAKGYRDDLGIGSDAKFAVENGELFDYVGDLSLYVCPLIRAKLAPAGEFTPDGDVEKDPNGGNIYRTYAMNSFFRCSQNQGWERLASKIGVSYSYGGHIPEPAKLLLFTEIAPSTEKSPSRSSQKDEARNGDWAHDGCINPKEWNSTGDQDEAIYAIHPSAKGKNATCALAVFFDGHIESVEPFYENKGNTAWFLNRGWNPDSKNPVK